MLRRQSFRLHLFLHNHYRCRLSPSIILVLFLFVMTLRSSSLFVTFNKKAPQLFRRRFLSYRCIRLLSTYATTTSLTDNNLSTGNLKNLWIFERTRNWDVVRRLMKQMLKVDKLPGFIEGEDEYKLSCLESVHKAGQCGEFISKNLRYSNRKSYAVRFGYDGTAYHGFQAQKNGQRTVEDDITRALGHKVYAAGRTDTDVSAVGQVVCFSSLKETSEIDIMTRLSESDPCREGVLRAYECWRVPRKFNSRSSAMWRRYLYFIPLNNVFLDSDSASSLDSAEQQWQQQFRSILDVATLDLDDAVWKEEKGEAEGKTRKPPFITLTDSSVVLPLMLDVTYMNRLLGRIANQTLPFNAFAYGEDRAAGDGLKDMCHIYKARASLVNVDVDNLANVQSLSPLSTSSGGLHHDGVAGCDTANHTLLCIELVGDRFLRQMVRRLVSACVRESLVPIIPRSVPLPGTSAMGFGLMGPRRSEEDEEDSVLDSAVRSDNKPERMGQLMVERDDTHDENENSLVDICLGGKRYLVPPPFPGTALCFSGVGYDARDMAVYRFMPKREIAALQMEGILPRPLLECETILSKEFIPDLPSSATYAE